MTYSDFTLLELKEQFGLTDVVETLFPVLPPVEPGDLLTTQLTRALKLPLRNEKAKSELVVSPILLELIDRNNDFFTFYSGENLPADRAHGLTGYMELPSSIRVSVIPYPSITAASPTPANGYFCAFSTTATPSIPGVINLAGFLNCSAFSSTFSIFTGPYW